MPAGTTEFSCSAPIGGVALPVAPYSGTLDAVGLDTSTLQADATDGTDPYRLFAKTGLLVHAGRESILTVPAPWAARLSIAWGNHAADWTTTLHIPACPVPPGGSDAWLAFPGGFSLDEAACVPLRVDSAGRTATVHMALGVRCPD